MNFFEVRERLDHLLLGEAFTAPMSALAMLRLLLEHTWYTTDMAGYVNRKVTGVKTLATLMSTTDRTVIKLLGELEAAGYIVRTRREENGKRYADDIYVAVLDIWYPGG